MENTPSHKIKLADRLKLLIKKFYKFFYDNKKSGLRPLTKEEYHNDLVKNNDPDVLKRAFEKAWEIRNFEIELYWKRATYFWTFIASTFAGYFALVNLDSYSKPDTYDHVEIYFVICIGFILSMAWLLTNIGSKTWQRHWEVHVDLLEDQFTGPLYKTVHPSVTYSVSKINEVVSVSFAFIWFLLGVKYFVDQDLINWASTNVNWFVFIATLAVILFMSAMFIGHGRGRFGDRPVTMYRRSVTYVNENKV